MPVRIYTIEEMASDFSSYRRKVRAVMRIYKVPVCKVGKRDCVDGDGYAMVRDCLRLYDARPVLAQSRAHSA